MERKSSERLVDMKKAKSLADVMLVQNAWNYRKSCRIEKNSELRYMAGFHYASYLAYRNARFLVRKLGQFESLLGGKKI